MAIEGVGVRVGVGVGVGEEYDISHHTNRGVG